MEIHNRIFVLIEQRAIVRINFHMPDRHWKSELKDQIRVKGVISAKMVKIIKFLFFAQKVSSGMGALRPKFLGGYRH